MNNIWTETMKEISFAPGYFCDQDGNFISTRENSKGKMMKATKHHTGYMIIGFMINKKLKQFKTHRVVAITHLPNPNNHPVVDHIDRDKSNHKLSNLRWTTYSENGKNCNPKKLTEYVPFTLSELDNEHWVKSNYFDGFGMEGIEVSSLGRYRYYYRGEILRVISPKLSKNYTSIKSRPKDKKGDSKRIQLHKLVWITFNGDFDTRQFVVNHKDGNKDNNRLNNLELLSPSENIKHAHNLGLVKTNKVYNDEVVQKIFTDFYEKLIPVYKVFKNNNKGSNDVTKLLRGDHDYYEYSEEQKELTKKYKQTQSLIMSIQASESSAVKVRDIKVFEKIIECKKMGYPVRKISELIGTVGSSFVHKYVRNNFELLKKEYPHLNYE